MDEDFSSAVEPPDASMQDAPCGVESAPNAVRVADSPDAPVTPLEHIAAIEKALDRLLISAKDPRVQKSLQDPIARVESRVRELAGQILKIDDIAVQRVEPLVQSIQHPLPAFATAPDSEHHFPTNETESLAQQVQRYRTQRVTQFENQLLSAQIDSVRRRMMCAVSPVVSSVWV